MYFLFDPLKMVHLEGSISSMVRAWIVLFEIYTFSMKRLLATKFYFFFTCSCELHYHVFFEIPRDCPSEVGCCLPRQGRTFLWREKGIVCCGCLLCPSKLPVLFQCRVTFVWRYDGMTVLLPCLKDVFSAEEQLVRNAIENWSWLLRSGVGKIWKKKSGKISFIHKTW